MPPSRVGVGERGRVSATLVETLTGRMVVGGIKAVMAMLSVPLDVFAAFWSRSQQ